MKMKNLLWPVLITGACGVAAMAEEAPGPYGSPPAPLVALAATGEASAPAGRAVVRLRVVAKEGSLGEAIARNNEYRGQVIRRFLERGISRGDIVIEKFSSTPEYGKFANKVKFYTLVNTIEVTISSEDQFLAIANVVDALSMVEYESRRIEFGDEAGLDIEASRKAMIALKKKAQAYEREFEVELALVSFSEVPVTVVGNRHAAVPQMRESLAYNSASVSRMNAPAAAGLATDFGEAKRIVGVEGLFRLEE